MFRLVFLDCTNILGRISGKNGIRRNILCHNATCADNCVVSNPDITQNCSTMANIYIISDFDDANFGMAINIFRACVMGKYFYIRGNTNIVSNRNQPRKQSVERACGVVPQVAAYMKPSFL